MSFLTPTGKEFKSTFRAISATVSLGSYCRYGLQEILSWGHMVVSKILGPDPSSISTITQIPPPRSRMSASLELLAAIARQYLRRHGLPNAINFSVVPQLAYKGNVREDLITRRYTGEVGTESI